jgi:hypothetical protein
MMLYLVKHRDIFTFNFAFLSYRYFFLSSADPGGCLNFGFLLRVPLRLKGVIL